MATLYDYTNVYATALNVIRKKGFQVWFDESLADFCAEREGWDFRSPTPTGLLGVIAIFEASRPTEFREYWWRDREALDTDDLPMGPTPYGAPKKLAW